MARMAGVLLVLLASASIALGSPLCCILGVSCCGTKAPAAAEPTRDCCPHCDREQPTKPAPKPCEKNEGCMCKHDAAPHATASAEHAPFVAIFDAPATALPERAAAEVAATSHRAAPVAPASRSHPLLL